MKITMGVRSRLTANDARNLNVITHDNPDVLTVAELRAMILRNLATMVDTSLDHAKMIDCADSAIGQVLRAGGLDIREFTTNIEGALDGIGRYLMRTPSFKWCDLGDVTTWPFTAGRATYELFVECHDRSYAGASA